MRVQGGDAGGVGVTGWEEVGLGGMVVGRLQAARTSPIRCMHARRSTAVGKGQGEQGVCMHGRFMRCRERLVCICMARIGVLIS